MKGLKHTEQQIIEISKETMKDIDGKFYHDNNIQRAYFNDKKELLIGSNKGHVIPCWTLAINNLFGNDDFLILSDESGQPLYYQNFNTYCFEVSKDEKGFYLIGLEMYRD